MKTIAFFNNKGGVGKTAMVYHLAWMLAEMGHTVVAADLDPQANLTGMSIGEDDLANIWENKHSIYGAIEPLMTREGGVKADKEKEISGNGNLFLLPGDLRLSSYEDSLSETWPKCLEGDLGAFRVQTAFAQIIHDIGKKHNADFALVDIGPNLGAINRAALIACDYVITPLSPDLFSWQGLQNFGKTLKKWQKSWEDRKNRFPVEQKSGNFYLPAGVMTPLGYVIMRYTIRLDRPVKSYEKWIEKMPSAFRKLLPENATADLPISKKDPYRLASLKDYHSLMPMAQEAKKPMFKLKSGDGAIGAHLASVGNCYNDFEKLAQRIKEEVQQRDSD